MTVLKSALNPRSAEFQTNADAMSALVADLREKVGAIKQGGGAKARDKHLSRGKLLPRERVESDVHLDQMPLADADKLVRLLSEVPIAAVLHGHRHTAFRLDLPGVAGPVPVICAGSAARAADEPARRPRAMIHAFDRSGLRSVDILVAAA